jgi:outer membrane usher protein FimD/PapC
MCFFTDKKKAKKRLHRGRKGKVVVNGKVEVNEVIVNGETVQRKHIRFNE